MHIQKDTRPIEVILIYPRMDIDIGPAIATPFSLLTIAAPLYKKGMNIKIIDQRVDRNWVYTLKQALRDKPVCCGISTMTGKQIFFGIEAAKIIREQTDGKVPIVWGGIHPTLLPEQTLASQYVDIVCVGEGDQTFPELVDALKNNMPLADMKGIAFLDSKKFIFTGKRPFLDIEELLPTPWELVNPESYIHHDLYLRNSKRVLDIGQTSRGCPYQCTFCYSSAINGYKWRAMSVEKALAMVVENVRRFNLDGIWFRDDEFCLDMSRVADICERVIKNNLKISWYTSGARVTDILKAPQKQLELLKRSGAHVMRFGAESGSNRVLEFIKKRQTVEQVLALNQKCRLAGIKPVYSLICGMPTETFEEINQTVDLFFRLHRENPDASLAPFCQYTAFPGTPLYDIAIEMGLRPPQRFEEWADWLNNEIDFKGNRLPWYNKKERRWLGNLTYLSNLAYSGADIIIKVENKPLGKTVNLIAKLFAKYFSWRLKRKSYYFVPELRLIVKIAAIYVSMVNRSNLRR